MKFHIKIGYLRQCNTNEPMTRPINNNRLIWSYHILKIANIVLGHSVNQKHLKQIIRPRPVSYVKLEQNHQVWRHDINLMCLKLNKEGNIVPYQISSQTKSSQTICQPFFSNQLAVRNCFIVPRFKMKSPRKIIDWILIWAQLHIPVCRFLLNSQGSTLQLQQNIQIISSSKNI